MILYYHPQPNPEEFRCIAESGARKPSVRGARPARTSTSTVMPGQRTIPFCFARNRSMLMIYLDRP